MAKTLKKKASKKAADAQDDAPVAPETQLIDQHSNSVIRVFDLGPLFGVECLTGTIHLVPKDRTSNQFRRSGVNIHYADRGFDQPPTDSKAYVTIEEVEELCTELTDDQREAAKSALTEDQQKEGTGARPSTQLGELQPPIRE